MRSFSSPSGPPGKIISGDLPGISNSLKCYACGKVFKNRMCKTRHYIKKQGKKVCAKTKLLGGRPATRNKQKIPEVLSSEEETAETIIHGPPPPYWPPAPTKYIQFDKCIPSECIRLPWSNPPEYLDRKTLRGVAQIRFYYDVCLGNKICDPLKVYEYFCSRKVFSKFRGLAADREAKANAL